jgi:hypothetical protein
MRRFAPIVLWLALVGVSHADPPPTQAIPVSDRNWFFSPSNWYVNGSAFAETQNTGAYFKIGFTGTSVALQVDVSSVYGPAAEWPLIRCQVDGNLAQDIRLKQQDALLPLNSQALASGTHSLTVWFIAADHDVDRWLIPSDVVRITGLVGRCDVAHLQHDTDLDPIRNRPDFQGLVMDLTFPSSPFSR